MTDDSALDEPDLPAPEPLAGPVKRSVRAPLKLYAPKKSLKRSLSQTLMRAAAVVAVSSVTWSGMALGDTETYAPRSAIDIRVGRNDRSGRIEIYGSVGSRASVRRENGQVIIRMPGQQRPDIGDIRGNLPIGVTGVDVRQDSRASELLLKVAEGYSARFGREDGGVFVQIEPDAHPEANNALAVRHDEAQSAQSVSSPAAGVASASAEPSQSRVPMLPVGVEEAEGGRELIFGFDTPVPAAVFRRGEAVWIVFDTETDLRLPPYLKDGTIVREAQWTRNDGFTALRLLAPGAGTVSVASNGPVWRVRIGGRAMDGTPAPVTVTRDDSGGPPSLALNMAGASRVAWIRDPAAGDRLAIIPALGPIKRMAVTRAGIDATLDATSHGAVIERMASDLRIEVSGDIVSVSRPTGMILSPANTEVAKPGPQLEYRDARYFSLVNPEWSRTPDEGFLARYNTLQAAAAEEGQGGLHAPTRARLALARFLVGQGMAIEAEGVIDLLARKSPKALDDPQVRGLRAAARMMSGRERSALADLGSAQLAADPSARLWQAYADSRAGHPVDALKSFQAGAIALDQFPPEWRVRIATEWARAALGQGDKDQAKRMIGYALAQNAPSIEKLDTYLVYAALIEATGDKVRAWKVYKAVATAPDDRLSTAGQLNAARLGLETSRIKAEDALNQLNSLRYRWRGDDLELEVIERIGNIYLAQGQYRLALQTLRSAGNAGKDSPAGLRIRQTLDEAFRNLFLRGQADGLQPVEALGLFTDFKEFTPLGPDGDDMVRRMVRRLVDVDLLDQAAELLDYQVFNRLDGVARSQVAADLAAIYLMNQTPEKALQTLWKTRTTLLPKTVLAERRLLEARALTELDRTDDALEVLGSEASAEANDIRADIFWRQKDWAKAGALFEKLLGDRYKRDGQLAPAEEGRLIRAGISYTLARDEAALGRLNDRFGKFTATASSPDAMRVALAPFTDGPISARDFAASSATTQTFTSWVSAMKKKFRESVTPAPGR